MREIDQLLANGFRLAIVTDDNDAQTVTVTAPDTNYDRKSAARWLAAVEARQVQAVDYFEYLCKYPLTVDETRRAFEAAVLGNNTWVDDATFTHRYTGQVVSVPTPQAMYDYTNGYPGPVPECRIASASGYTTPDAPVE